MLDEMAKALAEETAKLIVAAIPTLQPRFLEHLSRGGASDAIVAFIAQCPVHRDEQQQNLYTREDAERVVRRGGDVLPQFRAQTEIIIDQIRGPRPARTLLIAVLSQFGWASAELHFPCEAPAQRPADTTIEALAERINAPGGAC